MASLLRRILLSTSVLLVFATTANAAFNCNNPDPWDSTWIAPGSDDHIIEATPLTLGPVNPKNGGALWIMDSNGVRLEVCLEGDGTGACFYDPVDENNPYSQRVGFGPEAFWWLAEAAIDVDEDEDNDFLGFSALIVMAAEFAWISEDPAPNEQFPFTRLRFRLQVPELGTYYVTHPYGREVFVVDESMFDEKKEEYDRIFVSFDIELPTEGLGQGRIGPFLTSNDLSVPVPAGHIGSLGGAQTVTGSPCGTNWFEVRAMDTYGSPINLEGFDHYGNPIDLDGDGINVIRQELFAVMGKLAERSGVNVTRATYTRGDWDPGMEVFANTFADPMILQTLAVTATPEPTYEVPNPEPTEYIMDPGSVDPSGTLQSFVGLIGDADFARQIVVVRNATDPGDPDGCELENACESQISVPLVDMVNITEAYYNKQDNEVEIAAWTTDDVSTCPLGTDKLTAFADDGTYLGVLSEVVAPPGRHLGVMLRFTPGSLGPVETTPPRIIVKSCFSGSSDTSSLDIGLCERAGQSQRCAGGNGGI